MLPSGQPVQLAHRQLWFGGELQVTGNARRAAAWQVTGPALWHIHIKVRPRLPMGGDVGGKHGGHAVLHLPGAPGVLGRHARGGIAVLELRGLVDRDARADQVTVQIRDPGGRQRGQLRPQLLPVPPVGAEQGLHLAPSVITS